MEEAWKAGMVKVVQIGFSNRRGGIESFAVNYNQYLNNDDIQVDYINVFEEAITDDFYRSLAVRSKIYNLPNYRNKPIAFLKSFCKLNEKEHYDIFHYNMNSAAYIFPLYAAKRAGVKTIISHAHNSASDKGPLKEIAHNMNRYIIPLWANAFFACSEEAAKWFFGNKIRKGEHFYFLNNSIETKKFEYDEIKRTTIRNSLRIGNREIVVGNIARFNAQKNHVFLLDIFYELVKIYPEAKLLLIGDGPLAEQIRVRTENNPSLKGKVIFQGQINNANDYYSAMDVFVLPSIYEGLPYVGIEAQVNGLTCIFSDSITKELKCTENAFYLSLKEKPAKWAEEIVKAVQDKTERKTHVIREYDIENSARKLVSIYQRECAEKLC